MVDVKHLSCTDTIKANNNSVHFDEYYEIVKGTPPFTGVYHIDADCYKQKCLLMKLSNFPSFRAIPLK